MRGSILGAILAGGEARRFGSDKAAALLDGTAMIDHVAAALRPHVAAVVIVGRGDLHDRPHARLGPLGGLNAALHFALAQGHTRVLACPCDTPRLSAEMLAALAGSDISYVPALPVCGIWPAALAPVLDAHLAAGGTRSMRGWAAACGAEPLPGSWAIPNVNTPADLATLHEPGLDLAR